ncbi:hypothetical protein quinque_014569 [Culex quinquefasciatus]
MKNLLLVTAVICSALVAVRANPVPEARPDPEPKTDIELMKIPLEGDKAIGIAVGDRRSGPVGQFGQGRGAEIDTDHHCRL